MAAAFIYNLHKLVSVDEGVGWALPGFGFGVRRFVISTACADGGQL